MATESDNVNSGALGTLVAVGAFAMLGISLVVTALVRAETAEELEKKEVSADRPYRDLVAEQSAQLNAPAAYKDRGKGLVSLPIDRAMELVVSGLAKDPNSATPPPPKDEKDAGAATTDAASPAADASAEGADAAAPEGAEEMKEREEPKPPEDLKKEGAAQKKEAPKPAPKPVPAAPAPAAPTPAPAPAPPNGQ